MDTFLDDPRLIKSLTDLKNLLQELDMVAISVVDSSKNDTTVGLIFTNDMELYNQLDAEVKRYYDEE